VRAHQRAAHQRRRGDGAAALDLGGEVEGIGSTTLRVRCPEIVKDEPDGALVGRLRGSVLLLGPLLARRGARTWRRRRRLPGAAHDRTHLEALEAMGVAACRARPRPRGADGLKPTSIYLYEASVTGTETALLAAAAAPGVTEIRTPRASRTSSSCARFSQKLGVGVTGAGTSTIRVEGGGSCAAPSTVVGRLHRSRQLGGGRRGHRRRDRDHGRAREDMEVVAAVLKRMNIECAMDGDVFRVEQSQPRAAGRITTGLWPGFRATWSASSPCWRRRRKGRRWSTTGCTSCGCSRSSS
jgi:UDP-N-acetylglucosamine 1-carboxyvinyltransferase